MDLSLALEPTYVLDVHAKTAKHFIVIGAGGNGGYFIPQLIRQVSLQNHLLKLENKHQHTITIIDADAVEDKNLTRQNFIQRDIGKNKAEVMAMRYGAAFGVEVTYYPEYLDGPKMLEKIIASSNNVPFIVGAVDNNKTRAIVHEVFKSRRGTFWLDMGNEEWAGQVVLGYNAGKDYTKGEKKPHLFNLPSVTDMYPEILEATDKLPHEMSCAERAVSNPQNIFTNQTAANIAFGFANTVLTADARQGDGIKSHAVAFNAQIMSFQTTLNKGRFLVKEAPKVEEAPKAEVVVEAPKKKRATKKKTVEATA